jgi:hypothetical protein
MNYGHITRAVDFYQSRGYVYVQDAPWYVSKDAYYATKPPGAIDVRIDLGVTFGSRERMERFAVASGEQSFVQMLLDGQPLKRALCVTPCYRIEDYNDWHKPYFMKAELINAHDVDQAHLMHMIHEACSFFEKFFPQVRVIDTGSCFDIVEKDSRMELGSYGIRDVETGGKRLRWIYGTGCAEPRLSTVLERYLSRRDRL